jgi:hypothetical protein
MKHQHRHPCDDFTIKVLRCHKKYGKQGEDCVREELSQKKCFAQMLCQREARSFYDEKVVPLSNSRWQWDLPKRYAAEGEIKSSKVSCSTIMEVFAKPENELEIPEGLSREDRQYCRRITHELATCLAKKRKGQRMS